MTPEKVNWNTVQRKLAIFDQEEQWLIDHAYQEAKAAHRPHIRKSGERYFEHPRDVVLIILDEFKLTSADFVIAAFIHDIGEYAALYGNPTKLNYDEWTRQASFLVTKTYGAHVWEILQAVTTPHLDNVRFFTKEETHKFSLDLLKNSVDGIILKLADRLHNARSLKAMSREKILAKIAETREEYYPIFELAREKYPEIIAYGISEIEKAFSELE